MEKQLKKNDFYKKIQTAFENPKTTEEQKKKYYTLKGIEELKEKVEEIDKKIDNLDKNNEHTLDNNTNKLKKHNPLNVVNFLKQFKTINKSGLRELVHTPDNIDEFNLEEHLKKHFPLLNEKGGKKNYQIPIKILLPKNILSLTQNLIRLYYNEGIEYWKNNNLKTNVERLPFVNDVEFTKKIFNIKKSYRFGTDENESTNFYDFIMKLFNSTFYIDNSTKSKIFFNEKFTIENINFEPEDVKLFSTFLSFYNDVNTIKNGIRKILESIMKHSNINGNKEFNPNEKKIKLIASEENRNDKYCHILKIIDLNSVVSKIPNKEIFLSGDLNGTKNEILFSLCDWNIYFKSSTDNKNYKLPILPEGEIEEVKEEVLGYTNEFIFYD